jgi:hypothetical protein
MKRQLKTAESFKKILSSTWAASQIATPAT